MILGSVVAINYQKTTILLSQPRCVDSRTNQEYFRGRYTEILAGDGHQFIPEVVSHRWMDYLRRQLGEVIRKLQQ